TSKVISLHFSKQGRVLITASRDGVICELDTWTGKSKDTLKALKKSINSLTVSHDEKFMVVSAKTTKLYSMKDKKEILKIPSDDV
uniref:Anaphase-promoting complex subunit 4 WD40 domain-containing protein n=1 Tax=Aegilops tauschii subsp. strangulata TaxID=200361 RepID=A0A453F4Z0_AEGTS